MITLSLEVRRALTYGLFLTGLAIAGFAIVDYLVGCVPAKTSSGPDADGSSGPSSGQLVEAGAAVADGACKLLEGVTENATVLTICAYATEIADLAAFVVSFLRKGDAGPPADAGACTALASTGVCATRAELGAGISFLVERRRALFLLDAGGAR